MSAVQHGHGLPTHFVPPGEPALRLVPALTARGSVEERFREPTTAARVRRCRGWRKAAKRGLDLVVTTLALPFMLPVMIVVAISVRFASPGPVLFRQERIGRDGQLFPMLKFRTMYVDSAQRLAAEPELLERYLENDFKLDGDEDPRIAPLGRSMRNSSLDELPQLFNVLRGHMSLVGPRPIVPGELELYGQWADAYLDVKPGLTGRWQTDGRNSIRYPERAMLDAEYVEKWRLRSDLMILVKTLPSVLRRHGVH